MLSNQADSRIAFRSVCRGLGRPTDNGTTLFCASSVVFSQGAVGEVNPTSYQYNLSAEGHLTVGKNT
jgi:hypothetical protein